MENTNNNTEQSTAATTQISDIDDSTSTASAITSPAETKTKTNDYFERDPSLVKRERDIAEQDKKLLEALDEVLANHAKRRKTTEKTIQQPKLKQISNTVVKNGVGFLSLSLVLIFLGVMLLYTLFSPKHDFMFLLKIAPICLVLIGLEIFFNHFFTRGNIKVHIPSILISALLVIICCIMCLAFNKTFNEKNNDYNNRSMEAEIYDLSYKKLSGKANIAKLDVKVDLNPHNVENINSINSLSTDDYVDITITLSGIIDTPKDFAAACKSIIDTYKIMGINVTNFYFINESTLHTYNLKVEGKFAQDSTADELEQLVSHILIRDMDYLQDLEDLTDASQSTLD
ncbi:MAG: hypothetical protein ACI4JS_07080 [Oscillospiraceae bacterium]